MKQYVLRFNSDLYPKEALLKAAYHFIDKCYIRLDFENGNYIVEIMVKSNATTENIEFEFENELLAQTVRYQVYQQTHNIRELLMARAMSSTIVGASPEVGEENLPDSVDSLDHILKDWFERNEE